MRGVDVAARARRTALSSPDRRPRAGREGEAPAALRARSAEHVHGGRPQRIRAPLRPRPGKADTDSLSDDFTDLLVALGAAADERGRGVLFLLDEVQFLHPAEFGPFVVGLHRINQKALPLTCVAAGLPSLPALAGEAKSYAERLFTYPAIDRLDREAADEALARPAWARQVAFSKSALAAAYERTRGYPYFIQECGKYTWNVATGSRIDRGDVARGWELASHALDDGFFLVRLERATPAERRVLRALAELDGPPYPIAALVQLLGKRSPRQLSVQRDSLIKKGLVYSPRHATLDFTVPLFADYLRRRFTSIDAASSPG